MKLVLFPANREHADSALEDALKKYPDALGVVRYDTPGSLNYPNYDVVLPGEGTDCITEPFGMVKVSVMAFDPATIPVGPGVLISRYPW